MGGPTAESVSVRQSCAVPPFSSMDAPPAPSGSPGPGCTAAPVKVALRRSTELTGAAGGGGAGTTGLATTGTEVVPAVTGTEVTGEDLGEISLPERSRKE